MKLVRATCWSHVASGRGAAVPVGEGATGSFEVVTDAGCADVRPITTPKRSVKSARINGRSYRFMARTIADTVLERNRVDYKLGTMRRITQE